MKNAQNEIRAQRIWPVRHIMQGPIKFPSDDRKKKNEVRSEQHSKQHALIKSKTTGTESNAYHISNKYSRVTLNHLTSQCLLLFRRLPSSLRGIGIAIRTP